MDSTTVAKLEWWSLCIELLLLIFSESRAASRAALTFTLFTPDPGLRNFPYLILFSSEYFLAVKFVFSFYSSLSCHNTLKN